MAHLTPQRTGGPIGWLDQEQELLYQAALWEGEAALDAWRQLTRLTPVEDLEYPGQRALPLVFRNFERQGFHVPEWSALKSAYRSTWSKNQLLVNVGRNALGRLDTAGIDHILLKGSALMFLDYEDLGTRPMADLDLLVRPEHVDEAVAVLASGGWRSQSGRSPARIPLGWADELVSDSGYGLDLHWRVVLSGESEDDLWDHSVPLAFGRAESRSLCAPDRLLHVCVHGLSPSVPPAVRWAADAAIVVRRNEVDWDRVVDQARKRQVSILMGQALDYLRRAFRVPVPTATIEALEAGPHSRLEKVEMAVTARPMGLPELARWHWCRYRRVEPRRLKAVVRFPYYLRTVLGYDSRRTFFWHVLRRLAGARGQLKAAQIARRE